MAESMEGLAEVLGNLDRAVLMMAGPAAIATADLVAVRAVDAMKASVAVDTGELRDSIHQEGAGAERDIIAASDHAIYQEFGTSVMPAHPFFRPALHQLEAELESTAEGVYRRMVPGLT